MEVEVEQMEITIGGSVAEKILDTCIGTDEKRYYRVKWQPTWESEEDVLVKYHYLVEEFWKVAQLQQDNQIQQNMVEALLNKVDGDSTEEQVQVPSTAELITVSTLPTTQQENIIDEETPLNETIHRVNSPEHKVEEVVPIKIDIPPPLLPHDREGVVRDYKCDECFRSYDTDRKLKDHKRKLHSNNGSYKCTYCEKLFTTKRGLQDHLNRHTGVGPNVCPGCSKRYITVNDLQHHKRSCDGLINKQHQCEECKKCFTTKAHLSFHMKIHMPNEQKPFGCQYCPRRFAYNHDCVHHMRLHLGEKPFKCSDCDAAFHRKSYLTEHMFVHTGVSKYQCQECQKYFKTQQMLKTHVKNAHILKKEQGRKSGDTLESKLEKNEKRRMKRYRCDDCNKEFRYLKEYHFHQALNHKEKLQELGLGQQFEDFEPTMVYKCKKCNKTFPHASSLKRHAALHKQDSPDRNDDKENEDIANNLEYENKETENDESAIETKIIISNDIASAGHDGKSIEQSVIDSATAMELEKENNEKEILIETNNTEKGEIELTESDTYLVYNCPNCQDIFQNEEALLIHITEKHASEITIQNEDNTTLEFTVTTSQTDEEGNNPSYIIHTIAEENIIHDNENT